MREVLFVMEKVGSNLLSVQSDVTSTEAQRLPIDEEVLAKAWMVGLS